MQTRVRWAWLVAILAWTTTSLQPVVACAYVGLYEEEEEVVDDSASPDGEAPLPDEVEVAEPDSPRADQEAALHLGPPAADEKPDQLLNRAFELSKTAETIEEATAMIELCEAALVQHPAERFVKYGRELASWAYNKRGELLADSGYGDEALEDFESSIKLDPTRWKAFHNRAISLAILGRYEAALLDFDKAIQLKPNYANAYYNRGELHYEQGAYQKAIDDYSNAIRYSPRDSEAYNSRGHAYYKSGDLNRAIADYDRAIQNDAENAAAYVNRGDAFAESGQYSRAAADYRNAIRIAPELGRAYQSSAWLMATAPDERIRHPQYALDAARRAIEIDGESYRYLDTLAAAHANAGDFESAQAAQAQAIELAPEAAVEAYQARLGLYQEGRAFRDAPATATRSTTTARTPSAPSRQPARRGR